MTTQLTGQVLFQDDFSTNGPLNSANWDYNHWSATNNPSFLGATQMRQQLPLAENGMARIRLDTWLDGKAFSGSEAITNQAWDLTGGGVAFEGRFKFDSTQGGMITGFFPYQQFPEGAPRIPHDELDFEILTTQLKKISTNVYTTTQPGDGGAPHSIPMTGSFADWHVYRIEWLPSEVRWFVDGTLIRTDTQNVPTHPQQLHLNLWGVPGDWKQNPGDPGGPNVGDPNFVPAKSAAENRTFFFDVDYVKVERLPTHLGSTMADTLVGSAGHDAIDGADGDDVLRGVDGDDSLWGGGGNDTIEGGAGHNTISGGAGADRIDVGGGADIVRDTLADLNGDTLAGFHFGDMLHIRDRAIAREAFAVSTTGTGADVSVGGTHFQLAGDFSHGAFMAVARGSGSNASTLVTFETFLPDLREGARVDPSSINGIANEPFLTGDGATAFTAELTSAVSGFHNTLGVYKIAADGTISDVHVLFADTLNAANAGRLVDLGTPEDGSTLGFFLVQDGLDAYSQLPDDLSFVASGSAGGLPTVLHSASRGDLVDVPVFHSIAALNPNGDAQVLSGVATGGQQLLIGFEDLSTTTGDNDFQDVVLKISALGHEDMLMA